MKWWILALALVPSVAFGQTVTSSATTTVNAYGQMTFTATVMSSQDSSTMVDVEMYDSLGAVDSSKGTKTLQFFTPLTLHAGVPVTCTWNGPIVFNVFYNGIYTLKVGIFSPTWNTLYDWNNTAGEYTGIHIRNATSDYFINSTPPNLFLIGCH